MNFCGFVLLLSSAFGQSDSGVSNTRQFLLMNEAAQDLYLASFVDSMNATLEAMASWAVTKAPILPAPVFIQFGEFLKRFEVIKECATVKSNSDLRYRVVDYLLSHPDKWRDYFPIQVREALIDTCTKEKLQPTAVATQIKEKSEKKSFWCSSDQEWTQCGVDKNTCEKFHPVCVAKEVAHCFMAPLASSKDAMQMICSMTSRECNEWRNDRIMTSTKVYGFPTETLFGRCQQISPTNYRE